MSPAVYLLVFLGGALGSLARFGILTAVQAAGVTALAVEVITTAIVNLAGAAFLGFVHSKAFGGSNKAAAFWGSGFAGGFTTMSGLALITAGQNLGMSEIGLYYWLAVLVQFVAGILAYGFVRSRLEPTKRLGEIAK